MRNITAMAVLAAAAMMAAPASAVDIDLTGGGVGYFGNGHGNGNFTDVYSVALSDSEVTSSVINISLLGNNHLGDIDFSSITLGGVPFTHTTTESHLNGWTDVWSLIDSIGNPVHFAAGNYSLFISGHSYVTAAYAGTINSTPAVPEPAAWSLMMIGFVGIGYSMRSRRQQVSFS